MEVWINDSEGKGVVSWAARCLKFLNQGACYYALNHREKFLLPPFDSRLFLTLVRYWQAMFVFPNYRRPLAYYEGSKLPPLS